MVALMRISFSNAQEVFSWTNRISLLEENYDFSLKDNHAKFLIDLKEEYKTLTRIDKLNILIQCENNKPRGHSTFCEWVVVDSTSNDDRVLLQIALEKHYFDEIYGKDIVEYLATTKNGDYFSILESVYKNTLNEGIRKEIIRGLIVRFGATDAKDSDYVSTCMKTFFKNKNTFPVFKK